MSWMTWASLIISIASIGLSLWSFHNLKRVKRANERLDKLL